MTPALLLLPDFLLIALGAALKRSPWFDAAFWRGIERIVYFVLFPALLFRALATSTLAPGDASKLIVVGILFTATGMLASLIVRPLLRLPQPTFAACFQCGFRFNSYVALAGASSLGGARGVAAMSLLIGVLVPLVNIAAVAMLIHDRGRGIGRAIATNPLVIACAGGLLWNATGMAMPALLGHVLASLSAAALPLGLLAAGAGLAFVRGTLPLSGLVWWNALKLGILPAVALGLATLLGLSPIERQVAVLLAAVPTATSAYILAVQMNGVGAPVALLISSGTLLAVVTLPLWLAVIA
ncbi:MAG: AEC family transporter [Candidatus Levyibacteriota bacterium]